MFRHRDKFRVQRKKLGIDRLFDTPDEARRFELELELGIVGGSATTRKQNPPFEEFANRFLREYSKSHKGCNSHDEDTRVVRRHLIPVFSGRRIQGLAKEDLVSLRANLLTTQAKGRRNNLSPKTVNNILMIAKKIMSYAVELGITKEHPWRDVKPCKLPDQDFDFWMPDQRDEFYFRAYHARPELADLAYLPCHTGLRKGELAALSWTSCNFERRKIRVSQSYSFRLEQFTPPKGNLIKDVPMNDAAYVLLKRRFENRSGPSVFPMQLFQNLRRDFGVLCKRIAMEPIRFHDTRHTFASCLAMAGVPLLQIQELLRVKDYKMVLRYAHLHPDHMKGATDVLCSDTQRTHTNPKTCERELGLAVSAENTGIKWRTLSDSNARPSGSKPVVIAI